MPRDTTSLHWAATTRQLLIILSAVRLGSLGTGATIGLLYQSRMIDDGDCGAICGMKIGRGNRSTRRKPAPLPLCPPQSPHELTRARTRAAAVGNQRLTAKLRYGLGDKLGSAKIRNGYPHPK
jgi:hypothetical protein